MKVKLFDKITNKMFTFKHLKKIFIFLSCFNMRATDVFPTLCISPNVWQPCIFSLRLRVFSF